jgi:hypothetical protein
MAPTPVVLADILDDAAGQIERVGWGQGNDRESTMCAVEAIRWAARRRPYPGPLIVATNEAFGRYLSWTRNGPIPRSGATWGEALIRWNDVKAQTQEQVVAVMRACAEFLRDQAKEPAPS